MAGSYAAGSSWHQPVNSRNVDLYINLTRPAYGTLLAGRSDLTVAEQPVFVDGEKPRLRLQFLQPGATLGEAPSVVELAVGDTVLFALKKDAGAQELMVSGTGFALVGTGSERRYEAVVNFDTKPLVDAFGDERVLSLIGEVRVQNAAATERKSYQFRCTCRRRVYDGEADPVAADPEYPAADAVALRVPTNGTYRVKTTGAGQYFQLKHHLTGKWHSVFITGDAGAETFALAAGED